MSTMLKNEKEGLLECDSETQISYFALLNLNPEGFITSFI